MHLCLWSSFCILFFFCLGASGAPLKGKHLFLSSSHISAKAKSKYDGLAKKEWMVQGDLRTFNSTGVMTDFPSKTLLSISCKEL